MGQDYGQGAASTAILPGNPALTATQGGSAVQFYWLLDRYQSPPTFTQCDACDICPTCGENPTSSDPQVPTTLWYFNYACTVTSRSSEADLVMRRTRALGVVLASILASGQLGKPAHVLTISIDAPAQPDSPVHITGFKHDERDLWFALSSGSEKTVTSVIFGSISWAPPSCAPENTRSPWIGHVRYVVRMGPHGSGVAFSAHVHYPEHLVYNARTLVRTPYLLTQFVVDAVYFEDGTTWPASLSSPESNRGPFNPRQVEPEKCPDAAAVANELGPIREVTFDRESPEAANTDDEKSATPHLRFRCSLEGPKAICRMPLESAGARPDTGQQE